MMQKHPDIKSNDLLVPVKYRSAWVVCVCVRV